MAKGYWVAHVDIDDMERYKAYIDANAVPFREYGARFLVRGGTKEVREGQMRARTVVLEFDSYADAVACYESPGYQRAKDIRLNVADGSLVIVEGYDS